MKALIYLILIVAVVPLQSILLPHVSLWNVKPDLGLVAVCLVGLLAGELDGILIGLVIGWAMSLYSAGDLASSMVTKGVAGLLAGLAGRQLAQVTPGVLVVGLLGISGLAGIATASSMKLADERDLWWALQAVILPQACLDAAVGGLVYVIAWNRFDLDRVVRETRA